VTVLAHTVQVSSALRIILGLPVIMPSEVPTQKSGPIIYIVVTYAVSALGDWLLCVDVTPPSVLKFFYHNFPTA